MLHLRSHRAYRPPETPQRATRRPSRHHTRRALAKGVAAEQTLDGAPWPRGRRLPTARTRDARCRRLSSRSRRAAGARGRGPRCRRTRARAPRQPLLGWRGALTIFSGGGGVAEAELHELEQTVSRVEAELQRSGSGGSRQRAVRSGRHGTSHLRRLRPLNSLLGRVGHSIAQLWQQSAKAVITAVGQNAEEPGEAPTAVKPYEAPDWGAEKRREQTMLTIFRPQSS